ncbi:hypothetical protein AGMMS49974_00610 [Deltaproteobacteria bacterium]|nr:hypothetical protein AGMMS49974_00610 [Deltaproteobacteria bacterium]
MNYLIVEGFFGTTPFIFPRRLGRNDMRGQLPYGQIFFGGNAELGVKARPEEDAAFIAHVLRVR